jgi:hypothetical protein
MIGVEDILSLGEWEVVSIAKDGGTKNLSRGDLYSSEWYITSSSDNFLKEGDAKWKIKISYSPINRISEVKWEGIPENLFHLKKILVELGADMRWVSEIRDDKLNQLGI